MCSKCGVKLELPLPLTGSYVNANPRVPEHNMLRNTLNFNSIKLSVHLQVVPGHLQRALPVYIHLQRQDDNLANILALQVQRQ